MMDRVGLLSLPLLVYDRLIVGFLYQATITSIKDEGFALVSDIGRAVRLCRSVFLGATFFVNVACILSVAFLVFGHSALTSRPIIVVMLLAAAAALTWLHFNYHIKPQSERLIQGKKRLLWTFSEAEVASRKISDPDSGVEYLLTETPIIDNGETLLVVERRGTNESQTVAFCDFGFLRRSYPDRTGGKTDIYSVLGCDQNRLRIKLLASKRFVKSLPGGNARARKMRYGVQFLEIAVGFCEGTFKPTIQVLNWGDANPYGYDPEPWKLI